MLKDELRNTIIELIDSGKFPAVSEKLKAVGIRNFSDAEIDQVAELFSKIPEDAMYSSLDLLYCSCLIHHMKGDSENAAKFQAVLNAMSGAEIKARCALLQTGQSKEILLVLANISKMAGDTKHPQLEKISATGGAPSVLRGTADLSALGKYYESSKSIAKPKLAYVFDDGGEGICEAAIAEVLIERGNDEGAVPYAKEAATAKSSEIAFAGNALLARASGNVKFLAEAAKIAERSTWLADNYRALAIRFDIHSGDEEKVSQWLETADGLDAAKPGHLYRLITKAKALVMFKDPVACSLLEELTAVCIKRNRTLDTIECSALWAAALDVAGKQDEAFEKLEAALVSAQGYSYIRVFKDLGKGFEELLEKFAMREHAVNKYFMEKIVKINETKPELTPGPTQTSVENTKAVENIPVETEAQAAPKKKKVVKK